MQLPHDAYAERFGSPPARPARGEVIALGFDLSALNRLSPHPVYAWMRWVQILAPTPEQFAELRPGLEASLSLAREKWSQSRE